MTRSLPDVVVTNINQLYPVELLAYFWDDVSQAQRHASTSIAEEHLVGDFTDDLL